MFPNEKRFAEHKTVEERAHARLLQAIDGGGRVQDRGDPGI
jgi:hypothetical protein